MSAQTLASLPCILRRPADAAPLLVDHRGPVDAAGFEARVRHSVAWLRGQGIGPGDRVGVWLVNRIEWLALLFALARIGATLVAINTRYRSSELAYILERSGARLLLMQLDFRGIDFPGVLAGVDAGRVPALERIAIVDPGAGTPARLLDRPTLTFDAFDVAGRARRPRDPTESAESAGTGLDDHGDPDAVTVLFTTSGTTRGPKLVMHTQRSLATHAVHVARAHGFDAAGAGLVGALPLCGTFGLTAVLAAMAGGAPTVLLEAIDAPRIATLLREQALTHLYGSDEMYRRLRDIAPGTHPFPAARIFGYAAFQPGSAGFARASWDDGVPILGLYGSSEVQALFSIQQPEGTPDERAEGGGYPAAPDAEVRVRDVETGQLVAPGVVGEIEIRAPGNFVGYLDDPEATAAAIDVDGFFRSGDLGRLREDGSFVYLTRSGDAIRLGGFLVNPAEIEDTLGALDGVADAAVIAIEIEGQLRCVAFVEPEPGAELDEAGLVAAARQRMAGFKVPARIWFLDALPTTASANGAKVQRAKLREMALERLAASPGPRQAFRATKTNVDSIDARPGGQLRCKPKKFIE
ncbi:MAG: AMP-binding protein [Burkholderiaceae bacterium]